MKITALTGISSTVIGELKMGKPRTIELQSANNVVAVASLEPGPDTHLFLTSVDLEDISPGDMGIIVKVLSVNITMKRMIDIIHPVYYEERERLSARVQVRYCGNSMVKSVSAGSLCHPTEVDVVMAAHYRAV
ncbi:MAG: DUF473 domain-containing protein [Methanofollis liminatans]|jgi:hypothetical protein|uniref:DUF473 domain-containing protein n=1 Tax=Methanofollis liminatans DSM 4140 TaxID=28892 RepID=J1L3N7_9EURY|nr:DUF473 domain-containing protein [Methanofollis liminatans]EJG07707.1 protein of unknown function DUF473 [Methanofollis liminatans DSM 4140]MDD3112483.1 DUF473 domain-containing protein [Methanofollis liminatans]